MPRSRGGASISGRVTARKTGAPLGGIYVCTLYVYEDQVDRCEYTKPDGTYLIDRLENEPYKVSFNGPIPQEFFFNSYLPQFWEDQTSYASAVPISVAPPDIRTGVDAQLQVPAKLPNRRVRLRPQAKRPRRPSSARRASRRRRPMVRPTA